MELSRWIFPWTCNIAKFMISGPDTQTTSYPYRLLCLYHFHLITGINLTENEIHYAPVFWYVVVSHSDISKYGGTKDLIWIWLSYKEICLFYHFFFFIQDKCRPVWGIKQACLVAIQWEIPMYCTSASLIKKKPNKQLIKTNIQQTTKAEGGTGR